MSRSYPYEQMRYKSKEKGMILENISDSTQWTVYKSCGKTKKIEFSKKQWETLNFVAFIRRKPFFSIFTILFPLTGSLIQIFLLFFSN